ncbi:arachidonate 5-lipoxygenase-activating protein isoform X2 [Equus przewalskii]|uniref:Arachidonate 5-lipoxygenase-activating protein isoform X2 n=1 Tax=Equus przewalskii TaxID=9798 RepID=A0ABM2EIX8_EQUPR
MDQETVGNVVLLAIVTLISVIQNGFFAHKVEHESKTQNGRSFQRTGTLAFERVYTANSCRLCWADVPVREAEVLRGLSGREKAERWAHKGCFNTLHCAFLATPHPLLPPFRVWGLNDFLCRASPGLRTPGYIFGKRIILFLFLMSLAGIFNYYLILFFGSDFENYIKTITTTISPLLLIP